MARKRYETAFLPSVCDSESLRLPSPDADTLLLVIEGMSPSFYRTCDEDKLDSKASTQVDREPEPSPNPIVPDKTHLRISPSADPPMSAPLRTKRHTLQTSFSDDVTSIPSSSSRSNSVVTKGASISSLESFDSARSEDLHLQKSSKTGGITMTSSSSIRTRLDRNLAYKQHERIVSTVSTLSPIADKSPLDPPFSLSFHQQQQPKTDGQINTIMSTNSNSNSKTERTFDLMAAYELTNVPWEMPKLRKKLARLVDSGISLDSTSTPPLPSRHHNQGELFLGNSHISRLEVEADINTSVDSLLLPGKSNPDRFHLDLKIPPKTVNIGGFPANESAKTGAKGVERSEQGDLVQEENYVRQQQQHQEDDTRPVTNVNIRNTVYLDFEEAIPKVWRRIPFDPNLDLEFQDWYFGAISRVEAEHILKSRCCEGSFLVRNCQTYNFNQYSLSLKCSRGIMHIRIEPNSYGTYSLGDQEFPSVPHLVVHFMRNRLPIKGAEHVKLLYPVVQTLL